MESKNYTDPQREEGVCRICGCTDADCSQCIARTGEPCWWVEPDLCSACYQTVLLMAPDDCPGVWRIWNERMRQIVVEGHTPEKEDAVRRDYGVELMQAALGYLEIAVAREKGQKMGFATWPANWPVEARKPKDKLRDLTRAGALTAAAIDHELRRQQREAAKEGEGA